MPTPVDADNQPDLGAVKGASRLVGSVMARGAIVVYESTVYPGVTEDIAGPELEAASGLNAAAISSSAIRPSASTPATASTRVDRITKVVAGQTPEVTKAAGRDLRQHVTAGGVFVARDIRTAEAAKVIENAQRDINIAFINEVATIFQKMGLSIYDVLDAAGTNGTSCALPPGLVGGHCIGVDPFYLAHAAGDGPPSGDHPRRPAHQRPHGRLHRRAHRARAGEKGKGAGARVLVLGLTFKENVPDLRNSHVVDVVKGLTDRGFAVDIHDAFADADEGEARNTA